MKSTLVAATILIASLTAADAKGGQKVFNYPYAYDYSREKKDRYVKDYCEDSIGNHLYCTSRATGYGLYVSRWRSH